MSSIPDSDIHLLEVPLDVILISHQFYAANEYYGSTPDYQQDK